jgi:RNA polymerase sigma-70 factor, ECF subfamily
MNSDLINKKELWSEACDSDILAISQREPLAFEMLVSRYQREFLRKALRITHNKEDAQDIVQDTFVKIYKYAHKFKHQEGATFKSWAYTILTNTCFTYCKKKKRRQQFFTNADDDMLEMYSESNKDYERALDMNQVTSAIGKIPAMLGRMLTLALKGKTQEEIAVLEGVPVGTVRTRLHRAKKALLKVMT